MGSKRKLASKIINKIILDNPKVTTLYDLFGGGGAISFYALQHPKFKKVVYNELNTGVVELLKDLQQNGFRDEYWQWVDRETFNKHKDDNTWFGGLCSTVWSFGNNKEKGYIYGADVEPIKKLATEMICGKTAKDRESKRIELSRILKTNIPKSILNDGLFGYDMTKARRELARFMVKNIDKNDRGIGNC